MQYLLFVLFELKIEFLSKTNDPVNQLFVSIMMIPTTEPLSTVTLGPLLVGEGVDYAHTIALVVAFEGAGTLVFQLTLGAKIPRVATTLKQT